MEVMKDSRKPIGKENAEIKEGIGNVTRIGRIDLNKIGIQFVDKEGTYHIRKFKNKEELENFMLENEIKFKTFIDGYIIGEEHFIVY